MLEDKLVQFLKSGQDWARIKTNVPGIFILKLPSYKGNPPRLAVELNPIDESGSPKKRRGLIIRSFKELEEFKDIFQYDKLEPLIKSIDKINPPLKDKKDGEVLEI